MTSDEQKKAVGDAALRSRSEALAQINGMAARNDG